MQRMRVVAGTRAAGGVEGGEPDLKVVPRAPSLSLLEFPHFVDLGDENHVL